MVRSSRVGVRYGQLRFDSKATPPERDAQAVCSRLPRGFAGGVGAINQGRCCCRQFVRFREFAGGVVARSAVMYTLRVSGAHLRRSPAPPQRSVRHGSAGQRTSGVRRPPTVAGSAATKAFYKLLKYLFWRRVPRRPVPTVFLLVKHLGLPSVSGSRTNRADSVTSASFCLQRRHCVGVRAEQASSAFDDCRVAVLLVGMNFARE